MRALLTITVCLCLIAAITPAVSALNNWTGEYVYNGTTVTAPDGTGYCAALGHGSNAWNYLQFAYYTSGNSSFSHEGNVPYNSPYQVNGSGANNAKFMFVMRCTSPELIYGVGDYWLYQTGAIIAPVADFNGTPLTGQAPLYVAFTDASINSTALSTYNWSVSPSDGVIGNESTSEYPTMAFTLNGNYSITHCILNSGLSDCETKPDYISVYNDTEMVTTNAVARDLYTGFAIQGADVDMFDVENVSWTNTTASSNGQGSITTVASHHLNIWGSASGYNSDNLLNVPAIDGGYYSLLLKPTNITTTNVSAGNLTLFVTVESLELPHNTIQGAEVTAAWGSQYASAVTNAAGSVSFAVPNNTAVYLSAFKSGYVSSGTSYITGSANGGSASETTVIYIGQSYVTVTATATTGPGGTVPVTVDPRTPAEKEADIANILIDYGDMLVLFFIALTVIGGVKMIGK